MLGNPRTKPNCVCNFGDNRDYESMNYCWANLVVDNDEKALTCKKIDQLDETEPNNPKLYWIDESDPNNPKQKIYCDNSVGNTGITCYQDTDESGNPVCKVNSDPPPRISRKGPTYHCQNSGKPTTFKDGCPEGDGPMRKGFSGTDCRLCTGDGRMKQNKPYHRTMPPSARCPYNPSPSPSPK